MQTNIKSSKKEMWQKISYNLGDFRAGDQG